MAAPRALTDDAKLRRERVGKLDVPGVPASGLVILDGERADEGNPVAGAVALPHLQLLGEFAP